MQEKGTVHIFTRSDPAQVNEAIKTRSGYVIKNQTGSHTYKHNKNLAGMSASTK